MKIKIKQVPSAGYYLTEGTKSFRLAGSQRVDGNNIPLFKYYNNLLDKELGTLEEIDGVTFEVVPGTKQYVFSKDFVKFLQNNKQ